MVAVLGIPIDVDRLYECEDPTYLVWVQELVSRTASLRSEINNT